jgi:hypothetical protein
MAGHSQNRGCEPKGLCPACGRRGLGKGQKVFDKATRRLRLFRQCRYCHARVITASAQGE